MKSDGTKVYDHPARPWRDPELDRVECRACGVAVIGYDPSTQRHIDEAIRKPVQVKPADLAAVRAAAAVARQALNQVGPDAPVDAVADAIARALYERGALKVRLAGWHAADAADDDAA